MHQGIAEGRASGRFAVAAASEMDIGMAMGTRSPVPRGEFSH